MKQRIVFFAALVGMLSSGASDPAAQSARLVASSRNIPKQLLLTVRETAGVARSSEMVQSGVPLPRALDIRDAGTLAIVNEDGQPIPAGFRVLARWNAGRTTDAPIQWLLVSFPVTLPAHGSATYRLVPGAAVQNPAPTTQLSLVQVGTSVEVSTGAAVFRVDTASPYLFDEIRLADGSPIARGANLTATATGTPTTHSTTRRMRMEHVDSLSATIVIEGTYDLAPVGGGRLGSIRRYAFTAGSPTALVSHSIAWEGDRCGLGILTCGGSPNALRIQQVRDALTPTISGPLFITAVGRQTQPPVSAAANSGSSASIRQRLRGRVSEPLTFDMNVAGAFASGTEADGGVLAVNGSSGTLAIALQAMHRYEPQALRLLPDGRVAIDVVDDDVWLGARQGLFSTLAVAALPASSSRAVLDSQIWAKVNHPLRAWPASAWFAAADVVDEFPAGPLPPDLQSYDTLVQSVLTNTIQKRQELGLVGLMTFGLYPRYWGNPVYGDEIGCGDGDPTPGDTRDDTYWCASWTDYHGALTTSVIWAMRSGAVEMLDQIAFPGAQRMLHTQILQCAPSDPLFYCGQAPAGYGGYREDFNSSHAYFDNLFLYYWLTGDSTVVDTVARGASTMRNYFCSRRPAQACGPDDPPSDYWAQLTGRVASQWFAAFRFVGLASDDASFLDDFKSGLARAVTQHYVEVQRASVRYGFWLSNGDRGDGPGTDTTDQLWMASLYDFNNLDRLQRDTNDEAIGNPPLRPSEVTAAWARTLVAFGASTASGGNGTAAGTWPNALTFSWTGARIGGTLLGVNAATGGSDPLLYENGKATLTALLLRANEFTSDVGLLTMGADLTRRAIAAALAELAPLGKIQGLYLARLHAAVAMMTPPAFAIMDPKDYPNANTSSR